ncbi:MAG: hypothetical protein HY692_01180, partial [Cyanobacteria bacterium NC_groundwater_1444_Ag_S-0.65um_54_12]|nr:hypothetical protein [Cyanobacteria bacterium NC_groundwater_1444_Ag_S-0.65um_54_12]
EGGFRSAISFPILLTEEPFAMISVFWRNASRVENSSLLALLARQLGHLFTLQRDVADKMVEACELLGITSHELRTPLTAIKGFLKILGNDRYQLSPEEVRQFLSIADLQVDRATRLLDDLVAVSRLDGRRTRLALALVDLATIVEQARLLLVCQYPQRDLAVKCPPLAIKTDGDRLLQILLNLAENALKYSPEDSPATIQVTPRETGVAIAVSNHGGDLTPAEIALIFKKFERLDRHKNQSSGTGLGLYIARALAEILGGRVTAECTNGSTTFTVLLPWR